MRRSSLTHHIIHKQSEKIKYKPSEKEKGEYGKFIIENNDNFIVINKPFGIPVQAGTKSFKNIIDILRDTKFFEQTKTRKLMNSRKLSEHLNHHK